MSKPKVRSLREKYPKILGHVCLEIGEGWYDLIDHLCSHLTWDIDRNDYPQLEATQVKEKFGTLRFYYSGTENSYEQYKEKRLNLTYIGGDEAKLNEEFARACGVQEGMIRHAEHQSAHICEGCGTNQNVKQTTGWIVTICPDCLKKRNDKTQNDPL